MNKKGQGSFLLRVFSILAYMLMLMLVLVILNIPFCDNRDDVKNAIKSDSKELLQLRADEQLVSYLRTPMPDDLVDMIDKIKAKNDAGEFMEMDEAYVPTRNPGWHLIAIVSFDDAISFLEEHPEVYVGKTYGEFIIALEPYFSKGDDVDDVFDAATRVVFVQKVNEKRNIWDQEEVYFSPRIYVQYNADKIEDTDYRGTQGSVRSVGDLAPRDLQGANYRITYSTTVLPSNKNKFTLVQLDVPLANVLVRLPEP